MKSKAKHYITLVKPSAKKSNIQVSEAAQASIQEQISGFLGKHHSASDLNLQIEKSNKIDKLEMADGDEDPDLEAPVTVTGMVWADAEDGVEVEPESESGSETDGTPVEVDLNNVSADKLTWAQHVKMTLPSAEISKSGSLLSEVSVDTITQGEELSSADVLKQENCQELSRSQDHGQDLLQGIDQNSRSEEVFSSAGAFRGAAVNHVTEVPLIFLAYNHMLNEG